MKVELQYDTGPEWASYVLEHFDDFLLDHAACERKASATAMSFVVRYPDRKFILEPMIALAREELAHFHQVYKLIEKRGLTLPADEKDPYVQALLRLARNGKSERLLDRLLLFGIIERRGNERFALIADALEDAALKKFYTDLSRSEGRHVDYFVEAACHYFDDKEVAARLNELLSEEAKITESLELRSAVH